MLDEVVSILIIHIFQAYQQSHLWCVKSEILFSHDRDFKYSNEVFVLHYFSLFGVVCVCVGVCTLFLRQSVHCGAPVSLKALESGTLSTSETRTRYNSRLVLIPAENSSFCHVFVFFFKRGVTPLDERLEGKSLITNRVLAGRGLLDKRETLHLAMGCSLFGSRHNNFYE